MSITDEGELDVSNGGVAKDRPKEFSRGAQTAWIVCAVLAAGVMVSAALAYRSPRGAPATPSVISSASDVAAASQKPTPQVAEKAATSGVAPADHAAAPDTNLARSPRRDDSPINRELEMGDRHAVELNEMICHETGQNCEFARMARRHHEERYGAF